MKTSALKELIRICFYPMCFLAGMWGIFLADQHWQLNLFQYGVEPRSGLGLRGILFSPFIHGDLGHIASNSLPVLILGSLFVYFYREIALQAFLWIYFISGLWLWIGGRGGDLRPVYHIGASGIIYGLAAFLFVSGVLRRHRPLMVISALVVFLYGSLVWGLFPVETGISWEAHLFGTIAGIIVAFSYRKDGPQRQHYSWEDEPEDEDDSPLPNPEEDPEGLPPLPPNDGFWQIHYHYLPKKEKDPDEL